MNDKALNSGEHFFSEQLLRIARDGNFWELYNCAVSIFKNITESQSSSLYTQIEKGSDSYLLVSSLGDEAFPIELSNQKNEYSSQKCLYIETESDELMTNFLFMSDREIDFHDEEFEIIFQYSIRVLIDSMFSRIRKDIISVSFSSPDVGSFLHKSFNKVISKYLEYDGASAFHYNNKNKSLVLSYTSGLENKPATMSQVKFGLNGQTKTIQCFKSSETIVEESWKKRIHRGRFVENVKKIDNRLYVPMKVKSLGEVNFRTDVPSEFAENGTIGAIRFVNVALPNFVRFKKLHWGVVIIAEFISELMCVLVNRYIDELKVYHLQERASHGWTTDLAVIKTGLDNINKSMNLIEREIRNLDGGGLLDGHSKNNIEDYVSILNFEIRDLYSVQDAMGHQLVNVQMSADNYFLLDDASGRVKICEKPFVEVFRRSFSLLESFCSSYNRRPHLLTFDGNDKMSDDFMFMPSLNIPAGTLRLAVRNLLENAVKYTAPQERPRIDLSWSQLGPRVEICVRDYGIGIKKKDQENLFNAGWRADIAERLQLRGNGLGLVNSKSALQKFRGTLDYKRPKDNKGGSLFVISVERIL